MLKNISARMLLVVCTLALSSSTDAGQNNAGAGSYLRAKIDGKDWVATEVIPDKYPSEIVQIQGTKGSTSLWLQLEKPAVDRIDKLVQTDLNHYQDESFNLFMVTDGEIQVTKMDTQWIEGGFHFNATDKRAKKTIQVTAGAFRVPRPKK